MNDLLLILTIAIVLVCNLGTLWLYLRIERWMQTPNDIYGLLNDIREDGKKHFGQLFNSIGGYRSDTVSHAINARDRMLKAIEEDGKLTRERIAQEHKATRKETQEIKTRLTWSRKRELKEGR